MSLEQAPHPDTGHHEALRTAERLAHDLDAQRRREDDIRAAAYAAGYAAGYTSGYDVGQGHAEHQAARQWRALAERVRAVAHQTTPAERAAMDAAAAAGEPCGARDCRGCSRCIRAAAVARRGGDYTGGPVEWDRAEPLRRSA